MASNNLLVLLLVVILLLNVTHFYYEFSMHFAKYQDQPFVETEKKIQVATADNTKQQQCNKHRTLPDEPAIYNWIDDPASLGGRQAKMQYVKCNEIVSKQRGVWKNARNYTVIAKGAHKYAYAFDRWFKGKNHPLVAKRSRVSSYFDQWVSLAEYYVLKLFYTQFPYSSMRTYGHCIFNYDTSTFKYQDFTIGITTLFERIRPVSEFYNATQHLGAEEDLLALSLRNLAFVFEYADQSAPFKLEWDNKHFKQWGINRNNQVVLIDVDKMTIRQTFSFHKAMRHNCEQMYRNLYAQLEAPPGIVKQFSEENTFVAFCLTAKKPKKPKKQKAK